MKKSVPRAKDLTDDPALLDKRADEFWDEIDEIFADAPKPLQKGEITAPMLARRQGCSDPTARRRIGKKVESGLMESVGKRMVKGGPCEAWRMVKKK
jgi:Fic family protein